MTDSAAMAEDVFGPGGVPDDSHMARFAIPDGRFAKLTLPNHEADADGLPLGTPRNA